MKAKLSIRSTALTMLMASAMMVGTPAMAAYNRPVGLPTGGNATAELNATLNLVRQQLAAAKSTGSYTASITASRSAVDNFLAKHGSNQSDLTVPLMQILKQYLDVAAAVAGNNANRAPATGAVPMPSVQSLSVPAVAPIVPMVMPDISAMLSMFETTDDFVAPGCGSFARRCLSCKGSGSCRICYGTGRVTGGYGGERRDCSACYGTGRCTICGN